MPTHTIAENLQRLVDARTDIASAITAKGGNVITGDGFEDFASAIAGIPEGAEILDMIAPESGVTNNDLKAVYYDGKLFIFGSFNLSGSMPFIFTFPKSLQDIGISSNKTGDVFNVKRDGQGISGFVTNITITPTTTTISFNGFSGYLYRVSGVLA